jgi:XTP/dITP diphosphohydrolase
MLYFITSNRYKHGEIQKMTHIHIEQKQVPYPEIQADTLEAVAEFGAEFCYSEVKTPCFVEDSGLFIDALSGFPGVYSNYVYRTIGCDGILRLVNENRKAHFKSVIAYRTGNGVNIFAGTVTGKISETEKGKRGFGFDPIFIPEGGTGTFAQMTTEEKNLYSHRGKAFRTFVHYLEQVR